MGSRIVSTLAECDHQLVPSQAERLRDRPQNNRFGLRRDPRKLSSLPRQQRQIVATSRLKRTPLKKQSKGLKVVTAKYRRLETEFLSRPENKWCEICERRRGAGENILRNQSTEVHHFAGRIGRLLCHVPYFIASCYWCRMWPHENKTKARALGLLCPLGRWNICPSTGD